MSGLVFVRLGYFFVIASAVCLISTQGQKKGFRGGDKSYGIKVEATAIGTNLQYKLPEAKAKSSSPTDWQVDNDNAEMLFAMNSPILANVITKNPKFSVKGQWPAYKTTLTIPKGVKTGSKKNELVKVDAYQGSGFESESLDEEEVSGSGRSIVGEKVSDSSESSSGIYEGLGDRDLEETIETSSGSGSAEDEEHLPPDGQENRDTQTGNENQQRRSDVAKIPQQQKDESEDDLKDLSFEKVRLAVGSLGHFNLKDQRTSKALKDIITHAKKVVREAKMVLNDVASVVTSVRDFVNGNYNLEDQYDETKDSVLEAKNDSGVKKAREEAEKAALQASYAAKRAQAASEMARKFANKIWNSAKTSGSFRKTSTTVVQKNKDKDSLKKHGKTSFIIKNEQNEKEMRDVLKNFEKVLGNKLFKIEKLVKKNGTLVKSPYGKQSVTKIEGNHSNHVPREHSTQGFVVGKQRGNHSEYNTSFGNKKTITKEENEAGKLKRVKNVRIRMKSGDINKDSSKTGALKENSPGKIRKENNTTEQRNRKKADKNHADYRESLKAAKVEKLLQNSSKNPHKAAQVFSQAGRQNMKMPKMLLPWKHRLPGDTNVVVKNTEALLGRKAVSTTRVGVKRGRKSGTQRKGDKLQSAKELEGNGDVVGDTSSDDDVSSGSDQSGSTISGNYDIELELEPEKLEFVKGEGKMNEKRIRIKDLSANGERNKVPPATLKEILRAIKRVEGILGFTIEKTNREKKSHIYH